MKKLSVVALAVVAVMLFAIPAMAVDVDLTGQYRARGYFMDNMSLNDKCDAPNAYYDQRFRLQTVFKVHENLSVTTRWDAFDNVVWGTTDIFAGSDDSMQWDRAYLTAKFPWFVLDVGRMGAGVWGTMFADYAYNVERIKVTSKVDNVVFGGIIQKLAEGDGGPPSPFGPAGLLAAVGEGGVDECIDCGEGPSDQDRDVYFLFFVYKGEGWDGGLLYGYDRNRSNANVAIDEHGFLPYIKGKFGPVRVEAEAWWQFGNADVKYGEDYDIDSWAYYAQVGGDAGPVSIDVGYAHTDGQDKLKDAGDDRTAFVRAGGRDWQPLLILTGYYMDANLGCVGNLNMKNASGNPWGYDLLYGTVAFSPVEDVTLSTILAKGWADETGYLEQAFGINNLDDDFGWEWDIGLKWQIMDNLVYDAKAGVLFPGDFWEYSCDSRDLSNEYSVLHALTVTF